MEATMLGVVTDSTRGYFLYTFASDIGAETHKIPYGLDSDNVFTIIPHLTLLSPNGGQVLDGCASTSITWDAGGTSGKTGLL